MKHTISETKLRNIIKSTINESILLNEANEILNESMIAPNAVRKIYKSADGESSYIVIGDDGRFYEVYPSYNDSYMVNSDCDEYLDKLCKKIEQAFINHKIPGRAFLYNWNGEGEIIIEPNDGRDRGFTPELAEKLKVWMKNKGFTLRKYDEMYNEYHFVYNNYSDEISPERQKQLLDGYVDCTEKVQKNAGMMAIRSTMELFKELDVLSKRNTAFAL